MIYDNLTSLPICGRCGRAVDCLFRDEDLLSDSLIFTVLCHDEKEQVVIPRMLLEEICRGARPVFRFGVAFQRGAQLCSG
jgi:hypothetical protein